MLAQQLANGLVLGSIYALSALGFTLIFGAARVVNFAYGELLMLGAFFTLTIMMWSGLPFYAALPVAMVGIAVLSVIMFLLTLRPLLRGAYTSLQGELQVILVTLGLLYILREAAVIIWGTAPRQIDMGVTGIQIVGDVVMTNQRLVVIGVMAVLVLALYWILYRTNIGKALRAIAQNREGALAIGLNTDRIIAFVFAVSGAMACAAGSLLGALYAVEPHMGGAPLLKAFVIVIFGGLGSVPGAIVGGLAIGLIENLAGAYISFAFKDVFTFMLLIGVLLLRPAGLFGRSR
ncbi:MAG: branched-chain amino acid ABC transporter permease [Mesorhizobium sp.]|nr:branched-chain amino acid ABC transporter permease [Mesorhizobium sp.]MCO5164133.1 branched-chain amino acid ABC transporter permease [Mesorhizobium sp.]